MELLLRDGTRMLPRDRKIRAFVDASHERMKALPMEYDVTVSLKDARGRQQLPQQSTIDLRYMYGLTEVCEQGIHDAAKAITEIQESVKRWSDIQGRLRVWVRDEDRHRLDEGVEHDLTALAAARRRGPALGSGIPVGVPIPAIRSGAPRVVVRGSECCQLGARESPRVESGGAHSAVRMA